MRFLPYVLKTLWRHRSRTLLTVSGTAVALFVFCFVAAVQQGMDELQTRQQQNRSLVTFQANKFCPATSHLPQDYHSKIAALSGVRSVMPIQVFTNNCRASLDVVVFYGVPASLLRETRDFDLVAGAWSAFSSDHQAAVVGQTVAGRRGIRLGDQFTLGDLSVKVAAIFRSDDPAEESYIYTHLDFLQRGKGVHGVGRVTQFEVILQEGIDPIEMGAKIDGLFRTGPIETDTRPKGVFQTQALGDLAQLIGMLHLLGYACVGLMLSLVATTTVMSVQDRVGEHAVLQAIGFSGLRVFGLVMTESVLLSVLGGMVGVASALAVLGWSSLTMSAEAVSIAFSPSIRLAIAGLGVSFFAGTFAGIAPAVQAARSEIVPALRGR